MTKDEAVAIASAYVKSRPDLKVRDASEAFLVPAAFREEPGATSDAWVVWFPYILPDEVDLMEPDSAAVEVDCATKAATLLSVL